MTDIPVTVWKPSDGNGEYIDDSVNDIVDPSGNFLVDPSGNNIVDTGQTFVQTPSTVWISSDGTQ